MEKASAKLSQALKQLVVSSNKQKSANELGLQVQSGKISIEIQLTDTSEENLKALKKLGFELILQQKTKVIGKISLENLEALAKLKFVKQVTETK